MNIVVKIVAFKRSKRTIGGLYAGYCPAIRSFCVKGESVQDVIEDLRQSLMIALKNRLSFTNMRSYGWQVSENSAKPPIFADEYLVSETERVFDTHIENPSIIEINVELPRAERTIY